MIDSKWIEGLEPGMAIEKAARVVLEARLETVVRRLPQALYQAEEDPEHVHQLRVSTRRAGAALRIFADCLPSKTHRKVRKFLRRLRRSAGEARDSDVLLLSLGKRATRAPAAHRPGLDFLMGLARCARLAAQEHLLQATADDDTQGTGTMELTLRDLIAPEASSGTLAGRAGPMLAALVEELEQAAARDPHAFEHLHRVRILGKRLRYALEIFACCLEPAVLDRIYPAVENMQDILGDANDSHVAQRKLLDLREHLARTQPRDWKRWQPGIGALLLYHQGRLPRQRRLFQRWWREWQRLRAERNMSAGMQV